MIPVAVVATVIALIVFAVKRKKGVESEVSFTPHFILKVYLYFMLLASTITFVAGASFVLNAGIASYHGEAFSYRPEYIASRTVPKTVETLETGESVPVYEEPAYEIPAQSIDRDLIRGFTMVLFAALIGLIHAFVLKSVESKEERMQSPVYRLFVVLGLSIFTIGSLVAIPVGIYRTISYYVITQPDALEPYQRLVPGESLSSAIAYLPLWIYFMCLLYNLQKHSRAVTAPVLPAKAKSKKR